MNLLGHFVCAGHLSPEARLGAVLPDLVSLYRRRVRARQLVRLWTPPPPGAPRGTDGLLAGVAFHHHVDRLFHSHPAFETATAGLQAALRAASGAPGLKRFFPAHLLTEMYLDRLLMERRPARVDAFYAEVAAAGEAPGAPFVLRHPLAERAGWGAFLERFTAQRFLEDYLSDAGLVHRMNRVLVRMRQRALLPAEEVAATDFLAGQRAALGGFLAEFVPRMRTWHPPPEGGAWRATAAGPGRL